MSGPGRTPGNRRELPPPNAPSRTYSIHRETVEAIVLLTPRAIEQVADRIERAYLRRCPQWRHAHLDPRLWAAAAELLVDVNRREAWVPLDPELFVASQVENAPGSDPWIELTRPSSQVRYLSRV